jgi:hypothetical protein
MVHFFDATSRGCLIALDRELIERVVLRPALRFRQSK